MIGYTVLAYEAAAVLCNQYVVLNTYAAEVLIGLNLVEIEEFLAMAAGFPVVN